MEATIYKSTGNFYLAKDAGGKVWNCRIRGKLKISGSRMFTNPVAVGDHVLLAAEDDASAIITEVVSRENYIVRSSPHQRFQQHILAANLDQALLMITMNAPRTSQGFIDRFLITAEAYHIPTVIVCNKSDRHSEADKVIWSRKRLILEDAGYATHSISALEGCGVEKLNELLTDKTTLLAGHSGVGKSTLINALLGEQRLRVNDVSEKTGKGQHTTTFAEMMVLPSGGRIIDTPGIRELGVVAVSAPELSHYYPEMRRLLSRCKFNNCLHEREPGCAIRDAVNNGIISRERYEGYLELLHELS